MASDQGDSKPHESKTWVLKVSIHCEGCKKKVRKILQRVDGVDTIEINSQKNQVIVTGNVEAETLIARLLKSGKHSELWPTENKPQNPKSKINNYSANQKKEKNKETNENVSKSREAENTSVKKSESSETNIENEGKHVENEGEQVENEAKPTENSTKEVENKTEADTKQSDTGKKKKKKKEKEKVIEEKEKVAEEKDRSVDAAPMMHRQPMYHQPTYVASYNIAQPAQSYSHFAPMPQMPQNYASSYNTPQENHAYSYPNHPSYPSYQNYPPPQESYMNYPSYTNYPMYPNYPNYTNENQHGSMGYEASSSSQTPEGYDYFSEENPNSCSVM